MTGGRGVSAREQASPKAGALALSYIQGIAPLVLSKSDNAAAESDARLVMAACATSEAERRHLWEMYKALEAERDAALAERDALKEAGEGALNVMRRLLTRLEREGIENVDMRDARLVFDRAEALRACGGGK